MKSSEIDLTDRPKFDQMMADFIYFSQKYERQAFIQLFLSSVMGQVLQQTAEMDDESKSFVFAAGVQGLQEAANVMHGELFPFGHSGQPLTEA